jgi:3-deoxy-manno-octulosonate cytidylyltransferase (CMP-KDO synthetase)
MKTLIVVPARYGSTRFPGKPLQRIAGRSMVARVADVAHQAAGLMEDADYVVATDDERIITHCKAEGLKAVMTPVDVATGTDRALATIDALGVEPEVIINLQGDAPFTPAEMVAAVGRAAAEGKEDVATPVVRLSWTALDELRAHKKTAPFSGTTCIRGKDGRALWFSKNIIPAMRKEEKLRASESHSPVLRHIGLYAYRLEALKRFASLPEAEYEALEGLEQLRMLENGMTIRVVEVEEPEVSIGGVDTPEDLALAERILKEKGLA